MSSTPPPPPPPLIIRTTPLIPKPAVPSAGPPGAFLVELLVFNGSPFADHWAYWIRSHANPDIGVQIHADGDVRTGFRFEIKRSRDLRDDSPTTTIPLQWVSGRYFDEEAMLNYREAMIDNVPVCGFEASAYKVKAPEKSLNAIDETVGFLCGI
ncbi:hypothetical protein AWENTII_002108 [Aspergillus wentii]